MIAGWMLLLLGALIGGSFAVPGKRLKIMSWDGAWLIFCVVGLILVPCLLGLVFATPIFGSVFPQHLRLVATVVAAGALWGCGALMFGASLPRLGIALANAIVNGAVALVGSLGPLLARGESLETNDLTMLLLGLLFVTASLAALCWAALLRDRGISQQPEGSAAPGPIGVLLALAAGCLSSILNIGFVYGKPLVQHSIKQGLDESAATLAVWIPLLAGGFITNAIGTNVRLARAGEYARLASSPVSDWIRAGAMGLFWSSAILIYGLSTRLLGKGGEIYGWAALSGAGILVSTLWGLWLGEWTSAARRARLWLFAGLGLMLLALVLLSAGKGNPAKSSPGERSHIPACSGQTSLALV